LTRINSLYFTNISLTSSALCLCYLKPEAKQKNWTPIFLLCCKKEILGVFSESTEISINK